MQVHMLNNWKETGTITLRNQYVVNFNIIFRFQWVNKSKIQKENYEIIKKKATENPRSNKNKLLI